MKTTRLLLPFTGNISALALNYAIQLANQRQAILVPLALIRVKPRRAARLEDIQQAQDFLTLVSRKAELYAVPVEQARIYTSDVARSIEAITGEMNCEAVILFLGAKGETLLDLAEVRALMDHASCNAHLVLMPSRHNRKHFLHVPLLRRSEDVSARTKSGALLGALTEEQMSLAHHLVQDDAYRQ